jgi:hypothetical protein
MFTNLGISCAGQGFESMIEAYQTLCELWASPEYQEKSAKKRKSGAASRTQAFGADGYVCMG